MRFLLVILFLVLTLGATKETQQRRTGSRLRPQQKGRLQRFREGRFYGFVARAVVYVLAIATIAQTVVAFSVWPSIDVRPDAAISPSWRDLPMIAHNTSHVFPLEKMQFICHLSNVTWRASEHFALRVTGSVNMVAAKAPHDMKADGIATFPCEVAESWHAGGFNDPIKPGTASQWPIALIKMTIEIDYVVPVWFFNWHKTITSEEFTWRQVSGGYQWLVGDASDSIQMKEP